MDTKAMEEEKASCSKRPAQRPLDGQPVVKRQKKTESLGIDSGESDDANKKRDTTARVQPPTTEITTQEMTLETSRTTQKGLV